MPELTAVAITATLPENWYGGARPLTAGESSFYLDIKVAEGTKAKNEKARYVEAVFEAMTDLLGKLAPASWPAATAGRSAGRRPYCVRRRFNR